MKKQRKHYTAEEKVAILRRHLLDQEPVSKLGDEWGCSRRCSTAGRRNSSRMEAPVPNGGGTIVAGHPISEFEAPLWGCMCTLHCRDSDAASKSAWATGEWLTAVPWKRDMGGRRFDVLL